VDPTPPQLDSSAALPPAFFARPVLEVAHDLIGCTFVFDGVGGRLVEVEAYRADDPASHSYRGRTQRNAVMFGPPGHLYVYFTYGMHFCVNLVCHEEGDGAAVLLRALEPVHGVEAMKERRGMDDIRLLCSGPARLTQALGIGREHDGLPAWQPPAMVLPPPDRCSGDAADPTDRGAGDPIEREPVVIATPRVGISTATGMLWRFVDAQSRLLSRPLKQGTGDRNGNANARRA